MIEKFQKIANNVIDRLIMMGECCQTPRFLDIYFRTLLELPGSPNSKLLIDSWEKEMAMSGADSNQAQSEGKPALPSNVIGDEVLVAK